MASALVILAAGCQSEEVEILANNQVVWSSPLGTNRLDIDSQLGISQYKHPAATLTVDVDSPTMRTELLFFPQDPQTSFLEVTKSNHFEPEVATGNATGHLHPGGAASYLVGFELVVLNGLKPQSIRGVYQRRHGECELEVGWGTLLDQVLAKLNHTSGEDPDCTSALFCPNYDVRYNRRVATSYLRQRGVNGQGGFALYFRGNTEFDSPFIDDLSFYGKAGYDLSLPGDEDPPEIPRGLPRFKVSAGPWAGTQNCSSSPFTKCPHAEVQSGIINGMKGASATLNALLDECATAPVQANCETPNDCDGGAQALFLSSGARLEALARGMSVLRANQFGDALTDATNWRCAPVKQRCADLIGAEPTEEKVCQLKLRATDLIAMPNSFSLVWYPGDPGQNPVTAAQALYLGLTYRQQFDTLAQLCSPVLSSRVRAFVRRQDLTKH